MHSVEKEKIEIINLLLKNKNLEVNKPITESFTILNDGFTLEWYKKKDINALYIAIEKNNAEIVKLLLNCENIDIYNISDVDFTDKESDEANITALELARKHFNMVIIKLLQKKEAEVTKDSEIDE